MTFPTDQVAINRQLYRAMFGNPALTIGEHVSFAKLATPDADVRRSWILFGDPAMKLNWDFLANLWLSNIPFGTHEISTPEFNSRLIRWRQRT